MTQQDIDKLIQRMDQVLSALKNQNSGADIHKVNNIRNTAGMLISQLRDDPHCMKAELVKQIASNVETQLIDFYKEKYPRYFNDFSKDSK